MTTKQATCAERIDSEMNSLDEQIKALINDPESDWSDDPALSIDTTRLTKVCLSWGGPSDYLEIEWSVKGGIDKVTYRFSDWFDTATREVPEGSALWSYAELIVDNEIEAND